MKSIFITEEVNEGEGGRIAEFTLRFSSPLNDYRKNLSVARSLIKLSCSSSFFRVTCCMILLTFKQINHYMFWCEFRCALANIIFILHPFYLVWCYTCASLVFACRRAKKNLLFLCCLIGSYWIKTGQHRISSENEITVKENYDSSWLRNCEKLA